VIVVESRPGDDALPGLLRGAGQRFAAVPPLYHQPDEAPVWSWLVQAPPGLLVTDLHARAMAALLTRHGVAADRWHIVSRRETDDTAILAAVAATDPGVEAPPPPAGTTGDRWYPLLDKTLCTDCGHCHEFCLFGVYDRDAAGRVTVEQPDKCKPGCPACARICPRSAVMFALYDRDPAICGAPGHLVVLDAEARRLYYARTEAQCPACGQSGPVQAPGPDACEECGRPVGDTPAPAGPRDALDALLDELEDLAGRDR